MPAAKGSILVSGEALIDVIPQAGPEHLHSARLGGSPFNTAVALGRLGAPVAFCVRLSRDAQGEALMRALAASGVSADYIARSAKPSPLAWVTPAGGGHGPRYSFYLRGTAHARPAPLPSPLPENIAHLHVGSFAALVGRHGAQALGALSAARGKRTTSYDPNIRPMLLPSRRAALKEVEARVALASIVKASDEDMLWLYPERDPLEAARDWAGAGPGLVALTRGGGGASAFFGTARVDVPALKIKLADTIGAGDSFMAGLLCLMHEDGALGARLTEVSEANARRWLNFAGEAAAVNCSRPGADPPWRQELETP